MDKTGSSVYRHKVAVIDIGSNSIKVMVCESQKSGELVILCQEKLDVRISKGIGQGEGVNLTEDSINRGVMAVSQLVEVAKPFQPEKFIIVATSAVRSASNGDIFCERVRMATGYEVQTLSGEEEADAIAFGILTDTYLSQYKDFLAFDLGGGSMEYLLYRDSKCIKSVSFPLGAVRLTEKLIGGEDKSAQSYTVETFELLEGYIRKTLEDSGCGREGKIEVLVGTGGVCQVVRTILAYKNGKSYEEFGPEIDIREIEGLYREMGSKSLEERKLIPGLPVARADVFPAALGVIVVLGKMFNTNKLVHTTRNLRYGVALRYLLSL